MKAKTTKRIWLTVLSIFVIAMIMSTIYACTSAPSTGSDEETETPIGPQFVAHRGYSVRYFENSEDAFRAAAEIKGYYGIETDIRKTQDGYYVCHHNDTVKFADGASTAVISETDRDALIGKLIKNDAGDTGYICTFETYLQACKSGGKVAVIELKDSYFTTSDIRDILAIVDKEYDRAHITFISFSYLSLKNAQKADPTIPLQYLSQTKNDNKFDACLSEGISIDVKLSLKEKDNVVTDELVRAFHDAGLTVNVWTVDGDAELEAAYGYDVDYITTDLFYRE